MANCSIIASKPSTALIDAVKEAKKQETRKGMKLLNDVISNGPDLNEPDEDGFTALVYAVRLDFPSAVQLLVDSGATVDLIDEDGNTPFFYACTFQHWDVARILVQTGANPDHVGEAGLTPLLMAIDMQDVRRVETILELGASPNAVNEDGVPPIMVALCCKHLPYHLGVFQCLLEYGADLHVTDRSRSTPLMAACSSSFPSGEILELLFNKGVDLSAQNASGNTALHCAVVSGNVQTVEMLLMAGASPNVTNNDGLTPIYLAYPPSGKNVIQLLLCHGTDVNKINYLASPHWLMLFFLVRFGLDSVQELLAAGIELRQHSNLDIVENSPLLSSMAQGQYDITHLLLDGLFYTQEEKQLLARIHDTATGDRENMPETAANSGSQHFLFLNNSNNNNSGSNSNNMMLNVLLTKDSKERSQICSLVLLVPSLKQLSRRAIHRALGVRKNRTLCVNRLPIAPSLHRYLLFKTN